MLCFFTSTPLHLVLLIVFFTSLCMYKNHLSFVFHGLWCCVITCNRVLLHCTLGTSTQTYKLFAEIYLSTSMTSEKTNECYEYLINTQMRQAVRSHRRKKRNAENWTDTLRVIMRQKTNKQRETERERDRQRLQQNRNKIEVRLLPRIHNFHTLSWTQ